MLTDYIHKQMYDVDRELHELASARPRYERPAPGRSRIRQLIQGVVFTPAKATIGEAGELPDVSIRPATSRDSSALERLAEASERRLPSGLVLVAEVESEVAAALPVEGGSALTGLWRPTGDVVQLLELRVEQERAARRAAA